MRLCFPNKQIQNPDAIFEKFWLNVKFIMNYFYNIYVQYPNRVEQWSSILNQLQKNGDYYEIYRHIELFLCSFALNVMNSMDLHYFFILYANVKKWKKIKKNEESKIKNFNFNIQKQNNITFLCIDIFHHTIDNIKNRKHYDAIFNFFNNVENINLSNLRQIFHMAVILQNYKILESLIKYVDIKLVCKDYFNLDVSKNIKPKKLLEILTLTNIYNI